MTLIDERSLARSINDHAREHALHKEVRKSAQENKTTRLGKELGSGFWQDVQRVRKRRKTHKCSLKDRDGITGDNDEWT